MNRAGLNLNRAKSGWKQGGGVCVCVCVCVCVRRLGGREQGRTQYPISLVTRCHRTKAGGPHHGKAV